MVGRRGTLQGTGSGVLPPDVLRGGISRRDLLRASAAVAVAGGSAAALSGCGTAAAAGITGGQLAASTLQFWSLFSGGDGARLTTMLQGYEKAHGGPSSVQSSVFAWGNPYYTKVSLATVGSKPPDVAVAHLTRAKNLAAAGLLTEITDADLALVGLEPGDFVKRVWDAQKLDGKSWVIPLDTHPYVLYYNRKVCGPAGLLDGDGQLKPIQGRAAWEAALAAAKKVTGAYGATTATVGDTSTSWRWFQTLYRQQEGATPFLGDGGTKLTWNEDLVTSTLAYIRKLTADTLMPAATDYAGAGTLFYTGKAAFQLQGVWEITTAQAVKGLDFGMVPIPTIFDVPAEQADSHTFVLPRKDRTPEQMKQAMTFVKSMLDQSLTWAQGGHVPAYLPVQDSAAYQKLSPQSDYAPAAESAVYDSPAWYSGSGSNFEVVVGAQIGLVQQGLASPEAAVAAMKSQLQAYTTTPDPL